MKAARNSAGVLGTCLLALVGGDEFSDPADQQAAALVLAETILMWRRSVTKG